MGREIETQMNVNPNRYEIYIVARENPINKQLIQEHFSSQSRSFVW